MGDHDDGLAELVDRTAQQAEDLATGARVEVARRLVGEQHHRPCDERPGDGDALLLSARELRGPVVEAVAQAHAIDQRSELAAVDRTPGDGERQREVLGGAQHRQQVERLEDEADLVAAQCGELALLQPGDLDAVDLDRAGGGPVEPGEEMHEGRLARARRAHDGRQPAALEIDGRAAQRVHDGVALAVASREAARPHDGVGHHPRPRRGLATGGDGEHTIDVGHGEGQVGAGAR